MSDVIIQKQGENEALIAHLSKLQPQLQEQREVEFDGIVVPYVIGSDGTPRELASLVDKHRTRPRRREGVASFSSQESFDEHTNRFKSDASTLWGDRSNRTAPVLVSVLDYHEAGATGQPAFGRQRGKYLFPLSEEWQAWNAKDGRSMGQKEFAEFIEDRLGNVVSAASLSGPDEAKTLAAIELYDLTLAAAAQLLQLSKGLKVNVTHEVTDDVTLSSGESELQFKVVHTDRLGQKLKVPGGFVLRIPVFQGSDPISLLVRLRYSVDGGKVSWKYALHEATAAFDAAFEEACLASQVATGIPLFFGTPEA